MSNSNTISLGDYEQRVLLELDLILTWDEVSCLLSRRGFRLISLTIQNLYDQHVSINQCVDKIILIFSCYSELSSIDATD